LLVFQSYYILRSRELGLARGTDGMKMDGSTPAPKWIKNRPTDVYRDEGVKTVVIFVGGILEITS
jgi:hypothetical protein